MRIDKEKLKAIAKLPDDLLWEEVKRTAEKHKLKIPDAKPPKEDLDRLRSILENSDKLTLPAAMKLINKYRKGL